MPLREDLLPVFAFARELMGPDALDLRTTQVTIRTRSWTLGYRTAAGVYVDSDLVLPKHFKVRDATETEVLESGGSFTEGDVIVGPITPSDGAGVGYTVAQLVPDVTADGIEVIYVLTGGITGEYTLAKAQTDRPFGYELTLSRKGTTP